MSRQWQRYICEKALETQRAVQREIDEMPGIINLFQISATLNLYTKSQYGTRNRAINFFCFTY